MAAKKGALPSDQEEREKVLSTIIDGLARSRENENWGLMMEAAEDYQRSAVVKCFHSSSWS